MTFFLHNGKNYVKITLIMKRYFLIAWDFLKIAIIAAAIVLPIRYFLFQPFIVKGESMIPNLQQGNYLIIDEISHKIGELKRGDIVVFRYPLNTKQRFIKRIIGLPGETVKVKDGKIAISKNGENLVLDEIKYLPNVLSTEGNVETALGEDQYFVLGDNRQFSFDSRMWGILPEKDIIGRAVFRVYPFLEMSFISSPNY